MTSMSKRDLINAARDHLRLSIACTLGVEHKDYQSSLDIQNAVNRCLTYVMSLGYNESFEDALRESIQFLFFGGSPNEEEFDDLVEQLRASRATFIVEIAAYRYLHSSFEAGENPQSILDHIKEMTPLKSDY